MAGLTPCAMVRWLRGPSLPPVAPPATMPPSMPIATFCQAHFSHRLGRRTGRGSAGWQCEMGDERGVKMPKAPCARFT